MTKKQYVLKLLTALKDEWPTAKGLLVLIKQNQVDEETMDALIMIFTRAVSKVTDTINQDKIRKGVETLNKIKNLEKKEHTDHELKMLEQTIAGL